MTEYGTGIVYSADTDFVPTFPPPSPHLEAIEMVDVKIWAASMLAVMSTKLIAKANSISKKQARKIKKRAQIFVHQWLRGR